jgi:hypothetical protein
MNSYTHLIYSPSTSSTSSFPPHFLLISSSFPPHSLLISFIISLLLPATTPIHLPTIMVRRGQMTHQLTHHLPQPVALIHQHDGVHVTFELVVGTSY